MPDIDTLTMDQIANHLATRPIGYVMISYDERDHGSQLHSNFDPDEMLRFLRATVAEIEAGHARPLDGDTE